MIALFCGSREWTDDAVIANDIASLPADAIVVHGGAKGADLRAAMQAHERGLHSARVDALWTVHGRAAGPIRNRAMLRLRPDVVFAYSLGSSGTRDMINAARDAGIEVVVREPIASTAIDAPERNER